VPRRAEQRHDFVAGDVRRNAEFNRFFVPGTETAGLTVASEQFVLRKASSLSMSSSRVPTLGIGLGAGVSIRTGRMSSVIIFITAETIGSVSWVRAAG